MKVVFWYCKIVAQQIFEKQWYGLLHAKRSAAFLHANLECPGAWPLFGIGADPTRTACGRDWINNRDAMRQSTNRSNDL